MAEAAMTACLPMDISPRNPTPPQSAPALGSGSRGEKLWTLYGIRLGEVPLPWSLLALVTALLACLCYAGQKICAQPGDSLGRCQGHLFGRDEPTCCI